MKRRIFFWLEKLKITPAERKTVAGLMILLILLAGLNMSLKPSLPFENDHYVELEQQFRKRTAMLRQKWQKQMERYNPQENNGPESVVADTLPVDSVDAAPPEREPDLTLKPLVNINTADLETLKSLPGIGPAYARRIIAYRKKMGKFRTLEELKKIKGIAEKRLEKLKPFIKL